MTDLSADVGAYLHTVALNAPPPPIDSDPLVGGDSPIERLLRILGLAANADDPEDYAESVDNHAARDAKASEAAGKFSVQDQLAAGQVAQVASSAAGALAGAFGAAVQPLTQFPQIAGQAAAQALQAGLGAFGGVATPFPAPLEADGEFDDYGADDFDPLFSDAEIDTGALHSTDRFGSDHPELLDGLYGAAPMASLTPPTAVGPAPISPTAAPLPSGPSAPSPPGTGTAGIPIFPPTANAAAANERESKTGTKRISVPPVRNGAPVQGRVTVPPPEQGAMTPDGRPLATRRIVSPPLVGDVS